MNQILCQIAHRSYLIKKNILEDKFVIASSVALPVFGSNPNTCSDNGVNVWLDGEFYNRSEFTEGSISDERLLLSVYKKEGLVPFLKNVDGIFCAVIYDSSKKKIYLISDRYGLKNLYFCKNGHDLFWSSEIKSFSLFPIKSIDIDTDSVKDFFSVGHFLENRTWVKGVELISPASIVTFDINTSSLVRKTYWNWDQIPVSTHIDINETVNILKTRFCESVKKRCSKFAKTGLSLSGGLDSRAIFAAMPSKTEPIPAFTFGKRNCDDIRIAKKVALLRKSKHHIFEIDSKNWLNNRVEGVWLTDGQFNIIHMHGIEHIEIIHTLLDIELNGFLGDAFLGGSYCARNKNEIELFNNRGRRFINMGLVFSNSFYHTRIPFFDNKFLETVMSIPIHLRKDSRIYKTMLLSAFPEYFRSIPWQKTSLPISHTGFLWQTAEKGLKIVSRLKGMIRCTSSYADYQAWIRTSDSKELFFRTLINKNALINNFIDPGVIRSDLERHLSGGNRSEVLGLYLTFELWMQRFLNKKMKPDI
ncbi:MAG: asparagine synthase-related protein [Fibrobacter sp.]|nr:asparagine synthase-related protein [Fibrobacter sp.]